MKIQQMKPQEIYNAFLSRIEKTNMLYQAITDDSPIEMLSTIYFKYYFDISTAIEATIRGIAFERCKESRYLDYFVKPDSDSKSFFLKYDELEMLVDVQGIYNNANEQKFQECYFRKLAIFSNCKISVQLEKEDLQSLYDNVKKTRNMLAHGLLVKSVAFDNVTLERFLYVLYLLSSYYTAVMSA